jgi:predicted amidohydrolase YtcJ
VTPDVILTGGAIRTMDLTRPEAQALAIGAGRILALGSDAEILALAGPGCRRIDAGGRLVLPGFQDAHTHLLDGGTNLVVAADLYRAIGPAGLQAALRAHAAREAGLPLVMGTGWQAGIFGDHNLTADVLDAAVPDRPCLVYDSSFHNACMNSAAIAATGLAGDTPDPRNGHFVRDASGRATGMLHEAATEWAAARLPDIWTPTMGRGLLAGMALANRHGITGVIDASVTEVFRQPYLAAADTLSLRVAGAMKVTAGEDPDAAVARLTAWRAAVPGTLLQLNAAKFFLDGVFENRTAAMLAPYADPPGGNAALMFTPEQIARLFPALDAARFQIHVHCIGDLATRAALDGFAAARAANGAWPSRHQIAHLQVVDPADIPRLAALGVMANIQPLWARFDPVVPDIALDMIGPGRRHLTYPFRRMAAAGAQLAMGSDWPVTTLNPFEIIETAVTRQPPRRDGPTPPFEPQERLTVAECVAGYTTGAAAACWRDGFTGRLSPGFSADLMLLDRDILAVPADEIGETEVVLTLFRGAEVHRSAAFDG